jgi:hypothetical protein
MTEVDGVSMIDEGLSRDYWLAESGMCEPDCAPGCAPQGLGGRDRLVLTEDWRVVDRPGRGLWAEGIGAPFPEEWGSLLAPLPRFVPPPPPDDPAASEAAKALGYQD